MEIGYGEVEDLIQEEVTEKRVTTRPSLPYQYMRRGIEI